MDVRTDKLKRDEMIVSLREATADNITHGAKHWLRDKIDLEMWDMYVSDTSDLIDVIDLIELNEVSGAFVRASNLDTAVRDVIPTDVWNWMSIVHADSK